MHVCEYWGQAIVQRLQATAIKIWGASVLGCNIGSHWLSLNWTHLQYHCGNLAFFQLILYDALFIIVSGSNMILRLSPSFLTTLRYYNLLTKQTIWSSILWFFFDAVFHKRFSWALFFLSLLPVFSCTDANSNFLQGEVGSFTVCVCVHAFNIPIGMS